MEPGLENSEGLVDSVYDMLWKKRLDQDVAIEAINLPYWFTSQLPDTIIFKRNRPCWWYFSTCMPNADPIHNNRTKRKKSHHLNETGMLTGLLQSCKSRSGIVAALYSTDVTSGGPRVRTEYFDEQRLRQFLADSKDREDCALQVHPLIRRLLLVMLGRRGHSGVILGIYSLQS